MVTAVRALSVARMRRLGASSVVAGLESHTVWGWVPRTMELAVCSPAGELSIYIEGLVAMAKQASMITQIQKLLQQLRDERAAHVAAVEEIDTTLGTLGIEEAPKARRGRPKGSTKKGAQKQGSKKKVAKKAPRRKRRSFEVTGEQSVLGFVGQAKTPPNAKEINSHWSREGRGGKADSTIGKLVKAGQLVRVEVDGERGARYKVK
jgi:hypothetical protein